ncbi:MAG: hypothetical protein ACXV0U_04980 [Kineosporiaceae bacterium]
MTAVGLERPSFSGEVVAEFVRLESAGVVRLVHLLVVARAADGTLEAASPPVDPAPASRPGGRRAHVVRGSAAKRA